MKQKGVLSGKFDERISLSASMFYRRDLGPRRTFRIGGMVVLALLISGCGGGGGTTGGTNNLPGNNTGSVGRSDIYVGSALSPGFNLGVNTSSGLFNWVTDRQGFIDCAYPANQQWGAVFLTAGKPTSTVSSRTFYDYSSYNFLVLDLKGANGGESVSIGVKTEQDPDNGLEPRYLVSNLTTDWQTVKIPLASLVSDPTYPASRLSHLYLVCELVFSANSPETISFRNVHYEK